LTRFTLRLSAWASFCVAAVTAASAAALVVLGVLVLTGKTNYPVKLHAGPFSASHEISMPIAFYADICQSANVNEPTSPECLSFFLHDRSWSGEGLDRYQDARIKPISAALKGTISLETSGGWNGFVAAAVASDVLALLVVTVVAFCLWRLFHNAAAVRGFTDRDVRRVHLIGWTLIGGSLLGALLSRFTSPTSWGHSIEIFGEGPHLSPSDGYTVNVTQLVLGGLVLMLAEIFRRAATLETEHKLTV
jgi:hypothetical protein